MQTLPNAVYAADAVFVARPSDPPPEPVQALTATTTLPFDVVSVLRGPSVPSLLVDVSIGLSETCGIDLQDRNYLLLVDADERPHLDLCSDRGAGAVVEAQSILGAGQPPGAPVAAGAEDRKPRSSTSPVPALVLLTAAVGAGLLLRAKRQSNASR